MRIWELASGKTVANLDSHEGKIVAASFDQKGERVAAIDEKGTITLWHVRTARELVVFRTDISSPKFIAFSPKGDSLVAADDAGAAGIWDIRLLEAQDVNVQSEMVCKKKLSGASKFSLYELANPLLKDYLEDNDVCSRRTSSSSGSRLTRPGSEEEQRESRWNRPDDGKAKQLWDGVTWASTPMISPDYRHLDNSFAGRTFEFSVDDLQLLIRTNHFEPASADGRILFALRGAELVTEAGGTQSQQLDQQHLRLKETYPDHEHLRCVIGVYNSKTGLLSGFAGSTVPNRRAVSLYYSQHTVGNMMMTGMYRFEVGWDMASRPSRIPGTFIENGRQKAVWRSTNNLFYDVFDRLEDDRLHGDNIHPSASDPSSEFSSYGTIAVKGSFKAEDNQDRALGTHMGEWGLFRRAAGLAATGTEDHAKVFDLVMVTGLEAAIASSIRVEGRRSDTVFVREKLERLRQGSSGGLVSKLQSVLGLPESGVMDHTTVVALAKRQVDTLGYNDGILSLEMEKDIGICIFRENGC